MEYMKINQVCWDPEIRMLFVRFPDISFNIFFKPYSYENKWLGWKKVYSVYKNENPERMIGKTKKPPIRNIEKFMRMLIKNFKASPSNSDAEVFRWLWDERMKKKTTKD